MGLGPDKRRYWLTYSLREVPLTFHQSGFLIRGVRDRKGSGVLLRPAWRWRQAICVRDHRAGLRMIPASVRFHIFANPVGDATPFVRGIRAGQHPAVVTIEGVLGRELLQAGAVARVDPRRRRRDQSRKQSVVARRRGEFVIALCGGPATSRRVWACPSTTGAGGCSALAARGVSRS